MINKKIKIAFLGSGKIAIDLLIKSLRSEYLDCVLVSSRSLESEGLKKASSLNVNISDKGLQGILELDKQVDLIFDCTSAMAHKKHWDLIKKTDIKVIDMTPSGVGLSVVPVINSDMILHNQNINVITCGGQASIPMIHAVTEVQKNINYIEIVTSIASKSAGPATRANIDEYIDSTENGAKVFSDTQESKVILILNPAEPPVSMQTSISFLMGGIKVDLEAIKKSVKKMTEKIKSYVPGYELVVEPAMVGDNRLIVMVKISGLGDYLPIYAGNLDIINCAAISVAENFALRR
jgi:acetaldehyde dehydrogenase (acetylating)